MTTPAARLVTLIMLLQSRPNQKAAELAEKLGISVRSLHRYMAMLDEMGLPVYSERGPYGGFSLVRGYKLPPLVFTPDEAVAVCLGTGLVEEMWGHLYAGAAQGALAKLENLLPDEQRREVAWARRSLVSTGLHRTDQAALSPVLEKLRRAVRENRQVEMLYRSTSHPQAERRSLDPYVLVHRWGRWYVIGYCHLRRAVRSFRLDRIQELTLSDLKFVMPVDFELDDFLAREFKDQPQVRVHLLFAPEAAHLALDRYQDWETVEQQEEGVAVTLVVPDLVWAASTALSYGPIVTVLEPDELRQMVHDWAVAIADQNKIVDKKEGE